MSYSYTSVYLKECFTRVLKGHIALARAVFPNKTTGNALVKQYQRPETNVCVVFSRQAIYFYAFCSGCHSKSCCTHLTPFYWVSCSSLGNFFPSALLILGHRLDTLARMALWDAGLDYLHGTGHGIGSFLNVHEGMLHMRR